MGQLPLPRGGGSNSGAGGPCGDSSFAISSLMLDRACLQYSLPSKCQTLSEPQLPSAGHCGAQCGLEGFSCSPSPLPRGFPTCFVQVRIPAPDEGTGLCLQRPGGVLPPAQLLGESCLSLRLGWARCSGSLPTPTPLSTQGTDLLWFLSGPIRRTRRRGPCHPLR